MIYFGHKRGEVLSKNEVSASSESLPLPPLPARHERELQQGNSAQAGDEQHAAAAAKQKRAAHLFAGDPVWGRCPTQWKSGHVRAPSRAKKPASLNSLLHWMRISLRCSAAPSGHAQCLLSRVVDARCRVYGRGAMASEEPSTRSSGGTKRLWRCPTSPLGLGRGVHG